MVFVRKRSGHEHKGRMLISKTSITFASDVLLLYLLLQIQSKC